MLKSIIETLKPEVSPGRIMHDVHRLTTIDRWFTYPKFLESAEYVKERLCEIGTHDAKVIRFRADGHTLYGAWRTPLAWDARCARLTVVEPPELAGTVLCDYASEPCSLVMWSGPTAKTGVSAEVVAVHSGADESDFKGLDVRGKIVFTDARASHAKGLAAKHGAVGILTDWHFCADETPDARFWNNTFSDAPASWGPADSDSRLFGFCISPNQGRRLRALLAAGKTVRLHALADTRLYSGPLPVVTGILPGADLREQVLLIGHGFEQGAKDNASGAACMLEAMRVLKVLVDSGKLPRPRRTIRMLLTHECFGTLAYVRRFRSQMRNTVAALNVDSPAIDAPACFQAVHHNPQANASCIDAFAEHLAGLVWSGENSHPWKMLPFDVSDNLISHPTIGVPTLWLTTGGSRTSWHSTVDTPDRLSPDQMAQATLWTAVYMYFLADVSTDHALWMAGLEAEAARRDFDRELLAAQEPRDCSVASRNLPRRLRHLLSVHYAALRSALRFVPRRERKSASSTIEQSVTELSAVVDSHLAETTGHSGAGAGFTRHPQGDRIIPVSNYVGPITYDPIPLDHRGGHPDPRWGGPVNVALAWADGKRTLNQIIELAENELDRKLPDLADELLFLIKEGVIHDASSE